MQRPPLDDLTAERLLAGRVSPVDAPPGYAGLAEVIGATAAPGTTDELAREAAVVAAVGTALRSIPTSHHAAPRRKSMLTKLLTAKVAAVAATAVLGAGAAAAATGNLGPAQSTVSDALSAIHVSVPDGHANSQAAGHGQSGAAHGSAAHTQASAGPNSNADYGLCTAFLAGPNASSAGNVTTPTSNAKDSSAAFSSLAATAAKAGMTTTAYCQGVAAAHATATGKPADTGTASDTGKPASAGSTGAPVATPNSGGTGTANTASNGASKSGTGTAGTASSGASSAGSSNAPASHPTSTNHPSGRP